MFFLPFIEDITSFEKLNTEIFRPTGHPILFNILKITVRFDVIKKYLIKEFQEYLELIFALPINENEYFYMDNNFEYHNFLLNTIVD